MACPMKYWGDSHICEVAGPLEHGMELLWPKSYAMTDMLVVMILKPERFNLGNVWLLA